MQTKTSTIPSFTVSLRGYDRMEVDEYLDSLTDALDHVGDADEQNRRLQAYINRLNSRIKELEDRIAADTPKTGAVLGDRIGILLRAAEDAATDTINRAEARSAELTAQAEARVAEAEEAARISVAGGEEQARRIEAAARGEAAEIIAEAEARATARTRQIEQWAEQVVSHTRAEEARMLREHQEKRQVATAELRVLAEQRDSVAGTLASLRESLDQALGLIEPPPVEADAVEVAADAVPAEPETGSEPEADGLVSPNGSVEGSAELAADPVPEAVSVEDADDHHPSLYDREADDEATAPDSDGGPSAVDEAVDTDDTGSLEAVGSESPDEAEPGDADPADPVPVDADQESDIELREGEPVWNDANGDPDEFDAKFEAWVSEGAKHFKKW